MKSSALKTILMICPFASPNVGGVESYLDRLLQFLSKNQCKVLLVAYQPLTTQAKASRYENRGNVEIYRATWFGRGWFPKLERYFPLQFLYLFPGLFLKSLSVFLKRRREIDVIHAHGLVSAAIAKILAGISHRPSVLSIHAIYHLQDRKVLAFLIRWLLKGFSSILAVGIPSKKELIAIGLDEKKIGILANWVDVNLFAPRDREECRKVLNLDPSDFVVLFLGRFLEMKGLLILLEVAKKTNQGMTFAFVGDGPLSKTLQEAAQKHPQVRYLGRLSNADIVKAYNTADLFVSPVLYEEGFATVYLESLACGTPVITARRGCLPFFLSSEVADFLDVVDENTVKERLEFYFKNREILKNKRDVCRQYAQAHFSETNAKVILESYEIQG